MHIRTSLLMVAALAGATSLMGQVIPRRATFQRPDNDGRGRCTAVIVVDGAAEVDIRGDTALLRDLSGAPAQWRRFDCTGPMPDQPINFRFNGVDGRGRQILTRDPRDGRGAQVRIEDPQGGAGEYKFDIAWDARPGPPPIVPPPVFRRFSSDDAISACQGAVTQQAADRFRAVNIVFRGIEMDRDRPDSVTGMFEVRRGDHDERFRFSCGVDFERRQLRDVRIDPMGPPGGGGISQAIQTCQHAVEDRMHRDGFGRIEFVAINADTRPGRSEWIVGNVRAEGRDGGRAMEFSCSVDPRDNSVRSVDLRPR